MIFIFKKREIVLDCFTKDPVIYQLFQIQPAKEFYPDWWKELPSVIKDPNQTKNPFQQGATMRTCAGLVDYYKTGAIIPAWSDVGFQVGRENTGFVRVSFASPVSGQSSQHSTAQRGTYLPTAKYTHIKLESPWFIYANKPTQFLYLKPFWNFDRPEEILMPPGSINYYYQHTTNANLFLKHDKEEKIIRIQAGSALVHLVPQSEDKLIIKNHLVDEKEFNTRTSVTWYRFASSNGYARYRKMIVDLDRSKKKWWKFYE
jgi:hypothetical protein